jgi:hypothetical protein
MKRAIFGAMFAALALAASAQAQSDSTSLGDYARAIKKQKSEQTSASAKVYDNDNLPSSTAVNVVGATGTSSPSSNSPDAKASNNAATDSAPAASDDASKIAPGQSVQQRQKAYDIWKQRIDEQRKKIDQITSDLSDLQSHTPAAIMPPDVKQKYRTQLDEKQKALEQAKAGLADLQEQARKAGVPSSVTE